MQRLKGIDKKSMIRRTMPNLIVITFLLLAGGGHLRAEKVFSDDSFGGGYIDNIRLWKIEIKGEYKKELSEMEEKRMKEVSTEKEKYLQAISLPIERVKVSYNTPNPEVKIYNGVPTLFINGVPDPGISYFAHFPRVDSKYFKEFADTAGIHLFTYHNDLRSSKNYKDFFQDAKIEVEQLMLADSEAYFFPRLLLVPPKWWIELYPDEVMLYDDGSIDEKYFYCPWSEPWKQFAIHALRVVINRLKNLPYRDRIIGYQINAGAYGEWNNTRGRDNVYPDFSPSGIEAFRKWVREKYNNDISKLRKSWNKSKIDFENVVPPNHTERETTDLFTFRDPSKSRYVSDYCQFFNEGIANTIIEFAKVVKEETDGRALLFVFYGYIRHHAGYYPYLSMSGHLAMRKLLSSPYIDGVNSPLDYDDRPIGGVDNVHNAVDSIKLNNKLCFAENDIPTFLSINTPVKDRKDTLELIKRSLSYAVCKGICMYWMDLAHNEHWFSDQEILKTLNKAKRIGDLSLKFDRSTIAEVAVIIDENSPFYQRPGFSPSRPLLSYEKAVLARFGAPYDLYLVEDLANPKMPDYKVYIFLNTFYLDREKRKVISDKVKRNNNVVVWMYAPGFITEKGLSVDSMQELTGIKLDYEEIEDYLMVEVTNFNHPITKGLDMGFTFGEGEPFPPVADLNKSASPGSLEYVFYTMPLPIAKFKCGPIFFSRDKNVIMLGNMVCNNQPGFVVKKFDNWTSVYIGASSIPLEILRNVCKYAGVHLYIDTPDVVYANKHFLGLHIKEAGKRTIKLPYKTEVYDLFSDRLIAKSTSEFTYDFPQHSTFLYLLKRD